MKTVLKVMLLGILAGCGKQGSNNNPQPSAPPVNYIIGGQSNATYLLTTINGHPKDSSGLYFTPPTNNTVGYSVPGTDINYWLSQNNKNLLQVTQDYCTTSKYFVWWQGEGDSIPDNEPYFISRTNSLFSLIKNICPNIKIIEVIMEGNPSLNNGYFGIIQAHQKTLGDYQITAQGYELNNIPDAANAYHLSTKGYQDFWAELIKEYPTN